MRLIVVLTVLISLLGSFMLNQPSQVKANTPPPPAGCGLAGVDLSTPNTWMAVWDFETANGCLVELGTPQIPSQDPPIVSMTTIACTVNGVVDFSPADYARFQGNGYLSCDLDLPNNLQQTYPDFWTYVQAQFSTNGNQPLLHHPDAQMSVDVNGLYGNLEWQYRHTTNLLESNVVGRFRLTSDNRMVVGQCSSSVLNCPTSQTAPYAGYAKVHGDTTYANSSQTMVKFRTSATTVIIGYNPDTNEYLNGKLGMMIIDPYGKDPEPTVINPDPTPTVTPTMPIPQ
ncbi:hypothetical protein [Herpetosiphon llansteffanensis]|uniref:hypothetical protein n=1 Tax=Herpetosiphon llansteffanensis TaxID=2094568 RepID=UPI000D7C9860|nr:hypothetical protein [Herpetosiphon llansteffanensis]